MAAVIPVAGDAPSGEDGAGRGEPAEDKAGGRVVPQPPLRLAIVGAGVIGTQHARLIASLPHRARLAAVVDIVPSRAQALAASHGAAAYSSAAEAYVRESIDAVAVCVPSAWHGDVAVEALQAGKHVLIEKPLSTTLGDADRILRQERESGRTVAVVSQRRFQPAAVFMHDAVVRGRLGRVTSGIAESPFFRSQAYYDSGDWRGTIAIDGGGALMNQGIHALDLLLWMMGAPRRVSARTARIAHQEIEVEDVAAATIEFESGALGMILASTAAHPGLPVRVTVHGDGGVAGMDDDRICTFASVSCDARTADEELARLNRAEDRQLAQLRQAAGEGWNSAVLAHRAQYEDFIDAVLCGRPPHIGTAEGRRSLATVLAVYESARRGRTIDMSEVEPA